MSELKDLVWTVQSTVTDPDFDTIVRRANRRRTRRRAIATAATATAVVAVATVTATAPLRDRSGDPATTIPPPTQTSPLPPLRPGRDIVYAANAKLQGIVMTADDRRLASWQSCNADESDCQNVAVASEAGRPVIGTTFREWSFLQDDRGQLAGFVPPQESNGGPLGPTVFEWTGPGVLLTQTGSEVRETELTPGEPVTTFDDGDLLFEDEPGPWVVDPAERTVHRLTLPGEFAETRFGALTRDRTGRVWLTAGDPAGYLLWSDDGRNWEKVALGTDAWSAWLAVSPDGRTVAVAAQQNGKPHGPTRISHDRGQTWRQVPTSADLEGLVAFEDGTVLMSETSAIGETSRVSRINRDLTTSPIPGSPQTLTWLRASGDTVYGQLRNSYAVAVSTDRGQTWHNIVPR